MRKILFRGKTEEGKWLEGYLHKIDGIGKGYRAYAIQVQDIDTYMCRPHSHEVIAETVGQYVGIDKNGKRIFEGDIVKDEYGTYMVEFTDYGIITPFGYDCGCEDFEIIGNIHDNPELLKELQNEKDK